MRRTREKFERAADRFEQLMDDLDPATAQVQSTEDLRAVAQAADAVTAAQARLREAVGVARLHGRPWNRIALALGVSRQAARERFADKIPA